MRPVIALVDVNNFYASCERLFRPDLKGRPLVVLSNNDGCVVSRSVEAKRLQVPMAVPYYQIREHFEQQGGICFSSNYALYADLSSRVMRVLESLAPECEIYSIDEAFLRWPADQPQARLEHARTIRAEIQQWIGLTVSVGLGPTRTLAKLANYAAKRFPATGGVVDLHDEHRRHRLMAITPVDEIWGIGRRLAPRLARQGIHTVSQLLQQEPKGMRRQYGVEMERILLELSGTPCAALTIDPPAKQQIISSRSFGIRIDEQAAMRQALTEYLVRAAEKLRQEGQCCQLLSLFIRTSPFTGREPYYGEQASCRLPVPTDDTRQLLHRLDPLLSLIWRDGYRYQKGGVILSQFSPRHQQQGDLFDATTDGRLMQVVDGINQRNPGKLRFAAQGLGQRDWMMKSEHISPRYTTDWSQLPEAW